MTTQTATVETIGDVTVTKQNDLKYQVKAGTKRAKNFTGESAWSNAQRYANDSLLELHGYPTPGVFVL